MSHKEIPALGIAVKYVSDSDLKVATALIHRFGSKHYGRGQDRLADLYWAFAQFMEDEKGRRDELTEHARRELDDDTIGEILAEEEAERVRQALERETE